MSAWRIISSINARRHERGGPNLPESELRESIYMYMTVYSYIIIYLYTYIRRTAAERAFCRYLAESPPPPFRIPPPPSPLFGFRVLGFRVLGFRVLGLGA